MPEPFKVDFDIDNQEWSICCRYQPDQKSAIFHGWPDMLVMRGFANKRDAERASECLVRAGYDTDEKVMAMTDDEFRRITCENLFW